MDFDVQWSFFIAFGADKKSCRMHSTIHLFCEISSGADRGHSTEMEALESCHAVAEEGIPFREIAGVIARRLDVPVVSKTPEQAAKQFRFLGPFVGRDNPVSSRLTQERLGWRPTKPGLLADLNDAGYFA